jgi:predicted SAM-dependent methyltransferase
MPTEPYDLIVGWMVLEHLHNPIHALQKLWHWTRPGGWLVLSVPDAGALEFKVFKDAWYALHLPNHLYHYTLATLNLILERSGWKIERVFWHSNPNNLLQSLRYRCQDRGWKRTADYLLDIVDGRRQRYVQLLLGRVLGMLHASGRMTIWASRV